MKWSWKEESEVLQCRNLPTNFLADTSRALVGSPSLVSPPASKATFKMPLAPPSSAIHVKNGTPGFLSAPG